tara:strand:- start:2032 stop:2172 length:141 start_codon:yes stop_codon:yes gene_type:complete
MFKLLQQMVSNFFFAGYASIDYQQNKLVAAGSFKYLFQNKNQGYSY